MANPPMQRQQHARLLYFQRSSGVDTHLPMVIQGQAWISVTNKYPGQKEDLSIHQAGLIRISPPLIRENASTATFYISAASLAMALPALSMPVTGNRSALILEPQSPFNPGFFLIHSKWKRICSNSAFDSCRPVY